MGRLTAQIFLFGDQTLSFDNDLRQLLYIRDNETLTSFLGKANFALRKEIAKLPTIERGNFPRFTTLLDLLSGYREAESHPALELAVLCLAQLALFVKHYGEGSRQYPNPSESFAVGLCTGSLAAAAVCASRTVFELVPAAVEAVLVAFRTGLRSVQVRRDISNTQNKPSNWSIVLAMDKDQASLALQEFVQTTYLPTSSHPYLSAIGASNITISGPPAILEGLLQMPQISSLKPIILPIHAPYHAAHLYCESDIEGILACSDPELLRSYKQCIPYLSSASAELIVRGDYRSLLQAALSDILINQLRWDKAVSEGTRALIVSNSPKTFTVLPIISSSAQSLCMALSKQPEVEAAIEESPIDEASNAISLKSSDKLGQSKIAIVGHSGRFPDAASNQEFWKLLHEGLDVHREIPKDRFNVQTHYDPTGKTRNTSKVQYGCWIKEPGLFDARFFNMSPREANNTEPGQRMAVMTAYEALEMAGFVSNRTPSTQRDRVGVFYGMTSDDWREVNSSQNIDTYFIPGGIRAFTPGRINYYFKFSGPSFSVDTACSSSFAAIHTACNSLWRGDCDTAIAGGTNVLTNPDNFAGLDRGHFLSNTGNCNTFDDGADGYCRADAVGTVILKRLEDAELDNDPIYGVILGAVTNHSAEAESITRPHAGAQAAIFKKILSQANVKPLDVSYIEMHGTGTQAGDAIEMNSVLEVFAQSPRGANYPLHLGSAKANVGHGESASGVTALIKALMMMERNEIPPHCGIKTTINHNFPIDLEARNVNIAMQPTPWKKPVDGRQKRTVLLNNFSAAGGNTALLLEDAPDVAVPVSSDPRSTYPVAISAKSRLSLQKNIDGLDLFLREHPYLSVPALSYTTTARRTHHNYRVLISGHDIGAIRHAIQDLPPATEIEPIQTVDKKPGISFAFTGQGSLYSGMAQELFRDYPQFRDDILKFDRMAQSQGFPSFLCLIIGTAQTVEIPPAVAQLAIVCTQIALARLWKSWGIRPNAVVGHSLGEYAALYCAGVLSIDSVIYLVGARAQFMERLCTVGTHAMLAVKAPISSLEGYLFNSNLEISCLNGPADTVIGGKIDDVEAFASKIRQSGIKCIKLEVPFAFHTSQVKPLLHPFEECAKGIVFDKPSIPLLSPLLGEVVAHGGILGPSYLRRACLATVDFQGALTSAKNAGIVNERTIWVEIGSHPLCTGMIKSTLGSQITALSTLKRNSDPWNTLIASLTSLHVKGIEIAWDEYHRPFPGCHNVIQLPAYHWDVKNYWIQYENDFCLSKGEKSNASITAPPKTIFSSISTIAVQKVLEHQISAEKSTIIIESNLTDPHLARVLEGHRVNGVRLCPSSLYADIALTIGDYLFKARYPDSDPLGLDVADMIVDKALIATAADQQLFRASGSADWNLRQVMVRIYSVDANGKKTADHARCMVKFDKKEAWLKDWKLNTYLIKSRVKSLQDAVEQGQSHKIKRGMVYKLFGSFVEYGHVYQGMQDVVLDSTELEATARIQFQTTPKDENFYMAPYWIDSLGHIAGFVMNGNDVMDSKSQVFINHGWRSLRVAASLSPNKTYQSYNKMQNIEGTTYVGDTYIFDGDVVVALMQGVKFQGVPRKVLDSLLPKIPAARSSPQSTRLGDNISTSKSISQITVSTPKSTIRVREKSRTATVQDNARELPGNDIASRAISIVAEEIGVDKSELTPEVVFADIGLDSLMSLNLISRLREELGLDVESSLFADCATVKDLGSFLAINKGKSEVTSDLLASGIDDSDSTSEDSRSDTSTNVTDNDIDDIGVLATIRQTLAEEVGIEEVEITDSLPFAEMGVDSLLSLTILAKLREEFEYDLPTTLFADCTCLLDVAATLGLEPKAAATVPDKASQATAIDTVIGASIPPATSILLQGNPKTASKTLFLFPDGSGSATSYASLPRIDPDVAVYGLNCPYMKAPQDFKCSIADITSPYLEEIRRRQPVGPYYFGGWSAGGVCAFDAAQHLDRIGQKVARLILIDSPCPIGLEKLPPHLFDFLNSIGVFGTDGKAAPSWLLPHFLAFIDALDKYNALPFAPGRAPQTHFVWARDGVCKNDGDPRPHMDEKTPREMKWLINNRTDFGSNGWGELLGEETRLVIETMTDVNHFAMMAPGQKVRELAGFLKRAME